MNLSLVAATVIPLIVFLGFLLFVVKKYVTFETTGDQFFAVKSFYGKAFHLVRLNDEQHDGLTAKPTPALCGYDKWVRGSDETPKSVADIENMLPKTHSNFFYCSKCLSEINLDAGMDNMVSALNTIVSEK